MQSASTQYLILHSGLKLNGNQIPEDSELKALRREIENLKEDKNSLSEEVVKLGAKNREQGLTILRCNEKMEELQEENQKKNQLHQSTIEGHNKKTEFMSSTLEKQAEEISNYINQVKTLESDIFKKSKSMEQLNQEFELFKNQFIELKEQLSDSSEKSFQEYSECKNELNNYKQKLIEESKKAEDYQLLFKSSDINRINLETELENKGNEISILNGVLNEVNRLKDDQINLLTIQLDNLTRKYELQSSNFNEIQSNYSFTKNELNELNTKSNVDNNTILQLNNKIQDSISMVNDLTSKNKYLSEQIQQLSNQFSIKIESQETEHQKKISNLDQELNSKNDQLKKLFEEQQFLSSKLKSENDKFRSVAQQQEKRIDDLENILKRNKLENNSKQNKLEIIEPMKG
jgi:chromosome segregation ATPase